MLKPYTKVTREKKIKMYALFVRGRTELGKSLRDVMCTVIICKTGGGVSCEQFE